MGAPTLQDFTLVTSNPVKIAEYQRFSNASLRIETGEDLDEVDGNPDEVIIHKALAAGPGRMVEDSIMVIDGQPMIDIRWRKDALLAGEIQHPAKAIWQVRLGILHEGVVYAYLGETYGTICPYDTPGFGIDPIIRVDGVGQSLSAMDKAGTKDPVSARKFAFDAVVNQLPYLTVKVDLVAPWTGRYQNED
ncbi:non-canonical purine NTP pyrophosphatase [Pseudomonas serbica]|jgi:inosine/xanthosine triphosphate pyrophosphatase family protein|uniref:non-canonical purine NTP pyrophosphatase n=1 Tax=Pseudomonas serbica TaxID=2965074 RepID=UPI00237AC1CE|nr:non-canonical purine NTP pyrophosphatase [Pseudomonas serbica]